MNDQELPVTFQTWGIVDVMGHQRYVGLITEQVIAGTGFIRVDVPAAGDICAWTKLIGTSSVYAITPCSEEIARAMAKERKDAPIQSYELPRLEVAPSNPIAAEDEQNYIDDEEGIF